MFSLGNHFPLIRLVSSIKSSGCFILAEGGGEGYFWYDCFVFNIFIHLPNRIKLNTGSRFVRNYNLNTYK